MISLLSVLLFTSCGSKNSYDEPNVYSIKIGEFKDINSAKDFRIKLNRTIADSARIEKYSDNLYKVLIGRYISSYAAGKNAYRLNANGLIHSYNIMRDRHEILDEFRNVLFVEHIS